MRNFLDSAEYREFKDRCEHQRTMARRHPCYDMGMVLCEDYELKVGPWNLRLVCETYVRPAVFHASISYFKDIGDETIYEKNTGLPIFERAQQGMVVVKEWTNEEKDIANQLLGDLMGPLIPRKDTRVHVHDVFFARHWTVAASEVTALN